VLTDERTVLPVVAPQPFELAVDVEAEVESEVAVGAEVAAGVAAVLGFVVPLAVDPVAFAAVAVVVPAVTPLAMQAPRTAVAATLATPANTRDRAAGLRRRGRGLRSLFMDPIIRMPGKRWSKRT
jgi:hypothetical protein